MAEGIQLGFIPVASILPKLLKGIKKIAIRKGLIKRKYAIPKFEDLKKVKSCVNQNIVGTCNLNLS